MFKELKEIKTSMMTILFQVENINEEIKLIKKNQMEILELNSAITEMKNSLEELNRNLNWQKKKIVYLKRD